MKNLLTTVTKTLATSVVLSIAIAVEAPEVEAISLIQKDLFFGRNIFGGGEVSEAEFAAFVDNLITPRFPAGLTIFDADGQFEDSTGTIIEERSKLVTLFVEDTPQSESAIDEIVTAYLQQFNQESVLQVTNEDDLTAIFR